MVPLKALSKEVPQTLDETLRGRYPGPPGNTLEFLKGQNTYSSSKQAGTKKGGLVPYRLALKLAFWGFQRWFLVVLN